MASYTDITRGIRVSVQPTYLDDQSDPDTGRFVWAYHVTIENTGSETAQLTQRYWQITDAFGQVQEVRGPGVVGEQPVLRPGEQFQYTSGTPLAAPSGIMVGRYSMRTDRGEPFDVRVPAFSLDSPHQPRSLN